ncbi:carbonic anhydrase [Eubacteriaceae bacterium ES3]|nr:carbonic anhydrase [Eubacteriaceae bacterium ES3]
MKIDSLNSILLRLKRGNEAFLKGQSVDFEKLHKQRRQTAREGQMPDVVVIGCADSRVSPELIFNAGIGEMFVIRTAGNLAGELQMESVAYAVNALGTKLIVILGHSSCGAVQAAKVGNPPDYLKGTAERIQSAIGGETDDKSCELKNIEYGVKKVLESELIKEKVDKSEVAVIGAYYCLETGAVEFL